MKKLLLLAAAAGLAFATPVSAYTQKNVVYGQEDCKEGEKWNEETQKCEVSQ